MAEAVFEADVLLDDDASIQKQLKLYVATYQDYIFIFQADEKYKNQFEMNENMCMESIEKEAKSYRK